MKKFNYGRRKTVLVFITLLATFSFAAAAYAHGVVITYTLKANGEVELSAEFDTGEPMAEAQVTIYAPEDPLTPWLTGTADAEGRYVFVIDPEMPGIWDIQCRKAGHGDMVHLQLEAGMIDPALMDHTPGELLPGTLAAETETLSEAEAAPTAVAESGAMAVEEKSETAVEANQTPAAESEAETAAEAVVEPEPVTQVEEAAAAVDPAETETTAQIVPEPVSPSKETAEVTVLSSGGNTATTGGFTSFQIILMSASVIWGFVGTALYFSAKKTQDHSQAHGHRH